MSFIIYMEVTMSNDDWMDRGLESDSYEETCAKCGAVNRIEVAVGPKHGGWEEAFSTECASCGRALEPVKAFAAPRVSVIKASRPRR